MRFVVGEVAPEIVTNITNLSGRLGRASQILTHVRKVAPLFWHVQSQTKLGKFYQVYYDEKGWHCDCDDYRIKSASNPQHRCKHALAVELKERVEK